MLVNGLKTEAESSPDSDQQKKLLAAAKLLADATAKMVEAAKVCVLQLSLMAARYGLYHFNTCLKTCCDQKVRIIIDVYLRTRYGLHNFNTCLKKTYYHQQCSVSMST